MPREGAKGFVERERQAHRQFQRCRSGSALKQYQEKLTLRLKYTPFVILVQSEGNGHYLNIILRLLTIYHIIHQVKGWVGSKHGSLT